MRQPARGPAIQLPARNLKAIADACAFFVKDIGNHIRAIGCVFNHDAQLLRIERVIGQ